MRPPSRRLAPGARTARPPPLGRQGAAPGDQRAPPTAPLLPLRSKSRRRQTEGTAAPHPPRRGRCTPGEGAPRQRQAPPVNRPHAPALPAADRRRTSGAQDGAHGAAPSEAGLENTGARTRAGGFPPPFPPAHAALTQWRPTGPRQTPAAAQQRPRHEYTPGGHAGDNGWQADARRGRGAGGGRAAPQPPPRPPPSLRATGATLRPPGAEERPPSPRRDGNAGGGGGAAGPAHRAPQRPQPPAPAGVAADGRAHASAPERRADQAWRRRTAAHPSSMEAAPPMTPPMTIAHSGRAEGGIRSEGASGGAVHGPPLIPPPPGAAPRPRPNAHAGGECTDNKRAARVGNRGPPPRGGAGSQQRDPRPPTPPTGLQAAGAPTPTPRGRGDGPPSPRPREEPEHGPPPRPSRRLPQEPR